MSKKKEKGSIVGYIFIILAVVFFYLYYNDGFYAIESKYRNDAIRDVSVVDTVDPLDRQIDFERLKAINEDIVAWLYIPNTTVDYPILIGDTDEYYINKGIDKKYNPLGCIFSYSSTQKDLSDGHVKLFGHNMKRYQMFGELKKFMNEEYESKNKHFYIYLEDKVMEFDIFSIFTCREDDTFFSASNQLGTQGYRDFAESIINRNMYSRYSFEDSGLTVSDNQIFSLVTCYGSEGTSNRLVVNGVVAREKYYID